MEGDAVKGLRNQENTQEFHRLYCSTQQEKGHGVKFYTLCLESANPCDMSGLHSLKLNTVGTTAVGKMWLCKPKTYQI
jgi:hypothetical protein